MKRINRKDKKRKGKKRKISKIKIKAMLAALKESLQQDLSKASFILDPTFIVCLV